MIFPLESLDELTIDGLRHLIFIAEQELERREEEEDEEEREAA